MCQRLSYANRVAEYLPVSNCGGDHCLHFLCKNFRMALCSTISTSVFRLLHWPLSRLWRDQYLHILQRLQSFTSVFGLLLWPLCSVVFNHSLCSLSIRHSFISGFCLRFDRVSLYLVFQYSRPAALGYVARLLLPS